MTDRLRLPSSGTYPAEIIREPQPQPTPITASTLSANIGMMCQMADTEVWVSSDEEEGR